jgi:hypothetical protein
MPTRANFETLLSFALGNHMFHRSNVPLGAAKNTATLETNTASHPQQIFPQEDARRPTKRLRSFVQIRGEGGR